MVRPDRPAGRGPSRALPTSELCHHGRVAKVRAVARFVLRNSVRASVSAAGFTVLAIGLVMLVTPGPGLVVIIAGLAILATQFAWAERALGTARARAASAREAALCRAPRRQLPGDGTG